MVGFFFLSFGHTWWIYSTDLLKDLLLHDDLMMDTNCYMLPNKKTQMTREQQVSCGFKLMKH